MASIVSSFLFEKLELIKTRVCFILTVSKFIWLSNQKN